MRPGWVCFFILSLTAPLLQIYPLSPSFTPRTRGPSRQVSVTLGFSDSSRLVFIGERGFAGERDDRLAILYENLRLWLRTCESGAGRCRRELQCGDGDAGVQCEVVACTPGVSIVEACEVAGPLISPCRYHRCVSGRSPSTL